VRGQFHPNGGKEIRLPTNGEGTTSSGKQYQWSIDGFGELRAVGGHVGKWHDRAPSDHTLKANIANPNWGMVLKITATDTGTTRYCTIIGGYEPDDLSDVVDMIVEDYG
jgi:hypothetical protein